MCEVGDIALALDFVKILSGDDVIGQESIQSLTALAQRDPNRVIKESIRHACNWMGYEAFPFSRDKVAGDGVENDPRAMNFETTPSMQGLGMITAINRPRAINYIEKISNSGGLLDIKRSVLVTLAQTGIIPCSAEWVDGAVYRLLGIPRLGVTGDFGRGWLFINYFNLGWEGAKCRVGVAPPAIIRPSHWKKVAESKLVPEPFCQHLGGDEWSWDAFTTLVELNVDEEYKYSVHLTSHRKASKSSTSSCS